MKRPSAGGVTRSQAARTWQANPAPSAVGELCWMADRMRRQRIGQVFGASPVQVSTSRHESRGHRPLLANTLNTISPCFAITRPDPRATSIWCGQACHQEDLSAGDQMLPAPRTLRRSTPYGATPAVLAGQVGKRPRLHPMPRTQGWRAFRRRRESHSGWSYTDAGWNSALKSIRLSRWLIMVLSSFSFLRTIAGDPGTACRRKRAAFSPPVEPGGDA